MVNANEMTQSEVAEALCDIDISNPTSTIGTYCSHKATYAFVCAPFGTYYPERDTVYLCTRHFNLNRWLDYIMVGEPYRIDEE